MYKKVIYFWFAVISVLLFCHLFAGSALANYSNSFVSIVNPIRGSDFWDLKNQQPVDAVNGQLQILRQNNLTATFLLRFDGLKDQAIIQQLKSTPDEKGLFLEVTPSLSTAAGVNYHTSSSWHNAASVLLTGYNLEDRKKLIDTGFREFKNIFGFYPKSVGAWWIGAESLSYMQQKYGISSAMIVADQYSTDSYQIWGQYWGTPYYPAKNNSLFPAQSADNKIPVVIAQWANRDPVNGYGTGVEESTYSVQANDYLDYHNLNIGYFSQLVDTFTQPERVGNQFGQIVVGLENSYDWNKYKSEYQNQIKSLVNKKNTGQLQIVNLDNFANWYQGHFPALSPDQLIVAQDPLGSKKQAVWYMDNFYRVGWISNNEGSVIRDLRQYVPGQDELCLRSACNEVNFATFATRVLDEVTYGQKRVVDEGAINNLSVTRQSNGAALTYNNVAGKSEKIEFLVRDIAINTKPSSIDGFILDAIKNTDVTKPNNFNNDTALKSPIRQQLFELLIFSLSIFIGSFLPGWVMVKKFLPKIELVSTIYLSLCLGLVALTLVGFLSQVSIHSFWLSPIWILINLILFIYWKLYKQLSFRFEKDQVLLLVLIIWGTMFLVIPTFRSGLEYGYGIGFWGPNGHDGIWHLSLINELQKELPPDNPILSGTKLQYYHYFFDLLTAMIAERSKVSSGDLLFRDFPILFGLMLGLATLSLLNFLLKEKNNLISALSLYLVYSAGSFGWIVEQIKHQGFNGESDFWANQAISFNLNPPFIISLLILVAFLEVLMVYFKKTDKIMLIPLTLLSGTLLEFKAYAAILLGLSLGLLFFVKAVKKNFDLLPIILGMGFLTLVLLLPNYPSLAAIFQTGSGVFEFLPWWFIHSMIDSSDRIGWSRLAITRESGYTTHNIFKIIYAESLGLVLFIAGNLGVRIIGLLNLFKKRLWSDQNYQLIFITSIFSFSIPLFFIQKGTAWNTIQFFYYDLFLLCIFSAIFLGLLRWKKLKLILILLTFFLAPVNCIAVAQGYLVAKPHTFISKGEVEGLNFLHNQSLGIVLAYPYDDKIKKHLNSPLPLLAYETTAYVSAYSNKSSFEEDEIQQEILNFSPNTEYFKRISEEKDFFAGMDQTTAHKFLRSNHIQYIYLPKIFGIQLNQKDLGLKNIFENNEVVIYAVV